MEKLLYTWFCKHLPLSSEMLKTKAKELHSILQENSALVIDGQDNLRGRLQFISSKHLGKIVFKPFEVVPLQHELSQKITDINAREQIYNADETSLFWKLLPEKTVVLSNEKTAPEPKSEKVRMTFLVCTDGTWTHKIRLLMIGNLKNHRCFKNVNLPIDYKHSKLPG